MGNRNEVAKRSMHKNPYWPFLLWLSCFYAIWLGLVVAGDSFDQLLQRWQIALAMLLGSYVAGSTPMGGGTVGFPILVLVWELPATLGRNFALAIQSIGMVSASIYVLCGRQPIAWNLLRPALLGAALGTPLGAALIAPAVSDQVIKLTFAVVWASFGLMLLFNVREMSRNASRLAHRKPGQRLLGLMVGLIGGVVSSIVGVGIDMLIFAALVLRYQADLRVAVPTSVVLMAATSVFGIAANALLSLLSTTYALGDELYLSWLAAAPVVAVGAPLGALVVQRIPRTPSLLLVAVLCLLQYFWTAVHESISPAAWLVSLLAIVALNVFFIGLYRLGHPGLSGDSAEQALGEPGQAETQ